MKTQKARGQVRAGYAEPGEAQAGVPISCMKLNSDGTTHDLSKCVQCCQCGYRPAVRKRRVRRSARPRLRRLNQYAAASYGKASLLLRRRRFFSRLCAA